MGNSNSPIISMRRLDDSGQNYIPLRLLCGKEINQHYLPGKVVQCCRTECRDKSNEAIEECYKRHKQQLVAEKSGKAEGVVGNKKGRKRKVVEKEKGAA